MALTLSQAQAWRPETVQAVATSLKEKLAALGETLDGAKTATNKAAAASAGTGEEARFDFADRATAHGWAKHEQITQLQQVIDEAGYGLIGAHGRLATVVEAAARDGMKVWNDGSVTGYDETKTAKHAKAIGQALADLEDADQQYGQKINDIAEQIREGMGGFREADHKIGNFKDDPAPPPPGPGGASMNDWLQLPHYNARSLDGTETRTVYLRGEARVAALNEQWKQEGLDAEERARRTFDLRNSLRTYCRDLMVDQAARAALDETAPNLTWEQMLQKEAAKGNTGDNAYEQIAASAARSRDSVNKSLGIDPANPPPCHR